MKRNEEYLVGEKLLSVPFFYTRFSSTYNVYELVELKPRSEWFEVFNGGNTVIFPKWKTWREDIQQAFQYPLFEKEVFDEEDFLGGNSETQ